jgi:cytochrome c1
VAAADTDPSVSSGPKADPPSACHVIPGVPGARGMVGPPLTMFARRAYIAGQLPNEPDNLLRWLQDPQAVEPGTAMPNLGVGPQVRPGIWLPTFIPLYPALSGISRFYGFST